MQIKGYSYVTDAEWGSLAQNVLSNLKWKDVRPDQMALYLMLFEQELSSALQLAPTSQINDVNGLVTALEEPESAGNALAILSNVIGSMVARVDADTKNEGLQSICSDRIITLCRDEGVVVDTARQYVESQEEATQAVINGGSYVGDAARKVLKSAILLVKMHNVLLYASKPETFLALDTSRRKVVQDNVSVILNATFLNANKKSLSVSEVGEKAQTYIRRMTK